MTLTELSAANLVEIKDDAGWSLSINFGRGDKARDAMHAFSDAIRSGQLVERDAVAGVVEALGLIQSFGCPVCNGDCGSANPPVNACPMKAISAALTAIKGGEDADGKTWADLCRTLDAVSDAYKPEPYFKIGTSDDQ